jgi:hypothetical protein
LAVIDRLCDREVECLRVIRRAATLGEASGEVNGEDLTAEEPLNVRATSCFW